MMDTLGTGRFVVYIYIERLIQGSLWRLKDTSIMKKGSIVSFTWSVHYWRF